VCGLRAEKSHPKADGGNADGRLRYRAEMELQSFMQTNVASGN